MNALEELRQVHAILVVSGIAVTTVTGFFGFVSIRDLYSKDNEWVFELIVKNPQKVRSLKVLPKGCVLSVQIVEGLPLRITWFCVYSLLVLSLILAFSSLFSPLALASYYMLFGFLICLFVLIVITLVTYSFARIATDKKMLIALKKGIYKAGWFDAILLEIMRKIIM